MKNFKLVIATFSVTILFSSCATIFVGSKINARVEVAGHPQASISVNGMTRGYGITEFSYKRNNLRKFHITVKKEGCNKQTFNYSKRTFRILPFLLNLPIASFDAASNRSRSSNNSLFGINPLIFVNVIVDLATGAVWKPDINQQGVFQESNKKFNFLIDNYSGCPAGKETNEE